MFAQYWVPAHIAQGLTVLTGVQGLIEGEKRRAASRASTASAWLTLSDVALLQEHGLVVGARPAGRRTDGGRRPSPAAQRGAWARVDKGGHLLGRLARCAAARRRQRRRGGWWPSGGAPAGPAGGAPSRPPRTARTWPIAIAPINHQAGEGQAHLHRRAGGDQQVADAFVGRLVISENRGADEGEGDRGP